MSPYMTYLPSLTRGPLTTSVFLLLNIYLVGPTSWFCVLFYIARSGLLHAAGINWNLNAAIWPCSVVSLAPSISSTSLTKCLV